MSRSSQRHKMEVHGYNASGDTLPFIIVQLPPLGDSFGVDIGSVDITTTFDDVTGAEVKYDVRDMPPGLTFVDGVFLGSPSIIGVYTTSVFAVTDFGVSKPNTFIWTIT